MKKISSDLTNFYKNGVIIILLVYLIVSLIIYFIYKPSIEFLLFTFMVFSLFFIGWFRHSRNLKNIFMDNDKLIVDKNVIFFKEIVSIDKYSIGPNYRIKYYKDNEIKSFIFLPKFTLPFFTPTFIKEIKKGMKNQ